MKKILGLFLCLMVVFSASFAKETVAEHSGYLEVDFCYYPGVSQSSVIPNNFAVIDTGNWGIEGLIEPWYQAKIATPLGESWLVKDANLMVNVGLELTPVSIMPETAFVWEILPFLQISTGVRIGTGWDLGTTFSGGMSKWNGNYTEEENMEDINGNKYTQYFLEYDTMTPFQSMYFEPWAEILLQMDFSELAPQKYKKWTHIVFVATYDILYSTLTGTEQGQIWQWQLTGDRFTGWQQYATALLGYQFPDIPLDTIGLFFEFEQYFDQDVFHYKWGYDYSAFATHPIFSLAPLMVFKINDHHSITLQGRFRTYRILGDSNKSATGTVVGSAWYFDRIAISYIWSF